MYLNFSNLKLRPLHRLGSTYIHKKYLSHIGYVSRMPVILIQIK